MNELKPEDVMRALECCSKSNGVDACMSGCPLWETDTCPCVEDEAALMKSALALLREKDAEIERLTAYNANLLCANTDITNRHKDYVEEAERIARADAIDEFAERIEKSLTAQVNVSSQEMLVAFMWCLDLVKNLKKELKGERDGKSDL